MSKNATMTSPQRAFDAIWLSSGFFSYHPRPPRTGASYPKYNNTNVGFGVEVDIPDLGKFVAGNYRNSVYERSNYFGYLMAVKSWEYKDIRFQPGVVLGGIDGYPGYNGGRLSPLMLPVFAIDGSRFGINFVYVPPVGASDAFSVQFKFRLF